MENKRSFGIWLIATVFLWGLMGWIHQPLVNERAAWGLISWQFAATPQQSEAILASWDQRAQLLAAFGLGLDYLFLFTYAVTFSMASRWSARQLKQERWAGWVSALVWLAALMDAVENACLAIGLIGKPLSPYPEVASVSAALKFGLLLLVLGWILLGGFAALAHKVRAISPGQ